MVLVIALAATVLCVPFIIMNVRKIKRLRRLIREADTLIEAIEYVRTGVIHEPEVIGEIELCIEDVSKATRTDSWDDNCSTDPFTLLAVIGCGSLAIYSIFTGSPHQYVTILPIAGVVINFILSRIANDRYAKQLDSCDYDIRWQSHDLFRKSRDEVERTLEEEEARLAKRRAAETQRT